MLSIQEIQEVVPPHLKGSVGQGLVDMLNQITQDPEAIRTIRENFITHTNVLKEGRFKAEDYANAVAYVSFKLMGYTNQESYARTFPHRYGQLKARGASDKDISAYVAAYAKNKLVTLILEQAMIPVWLMHQDALTEAIQVQVDLMRTAKSEKVRTEAANSLLTHLKKPEKKEVALAIDVPESDGVKSLKDMLEQLAVQQRQLIGGGVTTREIAHQKLVKSPDIIEETAKDVTPRE